MVKKVLLGLAALFGAVVFVGALADAGVALLFAFGVGFGGAGESGLTVGGLLNEALAGFGVAFLAGPVVRFFAGRLDAILDAEVAADAARAEADMAAKRAADAERRAAEKAAVAAEMAADRARFEADLADLFGGLETVGSGEVDGAADAADADLFDFDDLPAEVQASVRAKQAEADKLRRMYERGLLSAGEYDRACGVPGKYVVHADYAPEFHSAFQTKRPLGGDRNGRDAVVGTGRFEVRRLVCDGLPPFVGIEMNPTRMPAYRLANVRAKYARRQQKGGTLN